MQYIDYTPDNEVYKYVIKKDIPAKVIGIQLMPEYYETYLKKELGINSTNLKQNLQVFPKNISSTEDIVLWRSVFWNLVETKL